MSKNVWLGFEDTSINFLFDFFLVNSYKILCGFDDFQRIIMGSKYYNKVDSLVLSGFNHCSSLFWGF